MESCLIRGDIKFPVKSFNEEQLKNIQCSGRNQLNGIKEKGIVV